MVSVPKTRPAFPEQFRREAIELLRVGRTPRELSESLGVSQQTLRDWRRQDQLDRHERDDGLTTDEREELRRLRLCPEGTSASTEESPARFRRGAFQLAAEVEPEPLIVPIAVANFDKKLMRTTTCAVVHEPFRLSESVSDPADDAALAGLPTLLAPRAALAAPRRRARRILTRRQRRVTRVAPQPTLERDDPLFLPGDALGQPLDLLVHPQQHRDNHLAALVIDRLRLGAFHASTFGARRLCPPNRLNAYDFRRSGARSDRPLEA
jgi:transposase-like protein